MKSSNFCKTNSSVSIVVHFVVSSYFSKVIFNSYIVVYFFLWPSSYSNFMIIDIIQAGSHYVILLFQFQFLQKFSLSEALLEFWWYPAYIGRYWQWIHAFTFIMISVVCGTADNEEILNHFELKILFLYSSV